MLYGYLNSPFVSNPFSDAAIPPSNLTSPVISGSGIVGQTLSTTNGTWSGTLPITYSYQWNRNGSIILGATFNTYTLVTADASTSITCTVTATNAGGFASSTSNAINVAAAGDADANAFIAAAAITDTTQKSAIEKLVVDLKGYGIWTKMKAIYPFVGGVASSHKFNLRSPVDSDAAFRLVFNGGWVHSSNGIIGNATNTFADTKLIPNLITAQNSFAYGVYSRINNDALTVDIGSVDPSNGTSTMLLPRYSNTFYNVINSGVNYTTVANASSLGFFIGNRTASNVIKNHKNGILQTTGSVASSANNNASIYVGASNHSLPYTSNRQYAFAFISDSLTDTEVTNYNTAVQTFQTTLGRQVGVPIVADSDAQAFLNAAVITDQTQANAVNTLVTDLKGYGIWTKMKALYPMVGGVASSHKFNLRSPVDSDAAFRLVFNGGWTHSATGALPNGTNAWANTFFKPSNWTNTDNSNMSYYSRINNSELKYEIGLFSNSINGNSNNSLGLKYSGNYEGAINSFSNNSLIQVANTDSRGFYFVNRNIANKQNNWKNGNKVGEVLVASSYNPDPLNYVISAYNINGSVGYFSSKECAFSSFGDGLTDTEAANYYTAVQTFQTTLSRNV